MASVDSEGKDQKGAGSLPREDSQSLQQPLTAAPGPLLGRSVTV